MNKTIIDILRDNYVEGVFHTHVSMISPNGKYQFNREKLEKFWDIYCELIYNNKDATVGIAEKPQQFIPVLVDIDIKIKEEDYLELGLENQEHLYTEEQVSTVIQIYQSVLRKIVENCSDNNLLCILLEKDIYKLERNGNTYYKNGFHLHFPNLFLDKIDQEIQLIPRVKEMVTEMNVFEDIGVENSGDLIDAASCTNPWLLYGSVKDIGFKPYRLSKIFNSELHEIGLNDGLNHYQIFDMKEQLINISNNIEYYLPRILSILPYGRSTHELKRGLLSPLKEKIKKDPKNIEYAHKLSVKKSLELASKLLPMIADYRAEDRAEWMTVGWILYNISDGIQEGLDMWLEFSARCPDKFEENVCIYEWDRMEKRDLSIGTLRYYASIDNPEAYKELKNKEADEYTHEALNGSHYDIAKILYAEYGDEFVCSSMSNKTWYQFKDHHWQQIEEGIDLRQKLSNEIVQRFTALGKKVMDLKSTTNNKSEDVMYDAQIKQIQKYTTALKQTPFKNNVMREACEVFYNPKFRDKLDKNKYLIGYKNGIYDLKQNIFRPGRPEDYISKTMKIEHKEFNEHDDIVTSVHQFIERIFPDKSVREYFMNISSEIFVGGNHRKHVYYWTGEGDNGKSVTQRFFEEMLGELSIKVPTTLLTSKKPPTGAAWPDLARAGNGVRAAWAEEPSGNEEINIGILKNLSGNDSIYARDLFEKGKDVREMKPLFKMFFICNKLPKVDHTDKATWNRIRVIPFESTFCKPSDPAPDTYEEQLRQKRFPMDTTLEDKIPGMVEAFAWILLQRRLKPQNFFEPEKVKMATEAYRRQNDIYRQFIEETIAEDARARLSLIELYNNFKEWHKESYPGYTIPVKNNVREYFIKLWGEPGRGITWTGYKIRTLEVEIENGDAVVLDDDDFIVYEDDDEDKEFKSNL